MLVVLCTLYNSSVREAKSYGKQAEKRIKNDKKKDKKVKKKTEQERKGCLFSFFNIVTYFPSFNYTYF